MIEVNGLQYYGTRLSENISRREPEGYLLCLNVPVARTGTQEYLPEELGLPGGGGTIPVYRPEEEVFAPETVASFEGMPVTNDHPPDGVDIENIRRLQMGHAHNVRRGTGEEEDLLLADLIITDPRLIDAILEGKREISCGYTYELAKENGQYIQRKIRGNHIAVVDAGRAGKRVSIKDKKPIERSTSMKKPLSKILARMAKDGDVEAVAEFIEELIGEGEDLTTASGGNFVRSEVSRNKQAPQCGAAPIKAAVTETPAEAVAEVVEEAVEAVEATEEPVTVEVPENHEIIIDEESLAGILQRLDQLIALLTPAAPAGDEEPSINAGSTGACAEEIAEVVEEVLEAAQAEEAPISAEEEVAQIVETILEPAISTTLEEDVQEDEGCEDPDRPDDAAGDALRAALMAVRPALAQMTPKQRRKASRDIATRLPYRSRNGKDSTFTSRGKPPINYADLGKRIMEKRNPHFQK